MWPAKVKSKKQWHNLLTSIYYMPLSLSNHKTWKSEIKRKMISLKNFGGTDLV